MVKSLLSPINDFVFHKIFGEHIYILTDFLESVLDLPKEEYVGLTVESPILRRKYKELKYGIVDLKILLRSGKKINVEIQTTSLPNFAKRIWFYNNILSVEQLESGDKYELLREVYSIAIVNFEMIKLVKSFHSHFDMYNQREGVSFLHGTEIHLIELPKMRDNEEMRLGDWVRFFNARTEEEFMNLAQKHPMAKEAYSLLKDLSADEEARYDAALLEKSKMDRIFFFEEGKEVGREEGLKKGREEGLEKGREEGLEKGQLIEKRETARRLLRKKMSFDDIAEATTLSLQEVRELASDLKD
jgi:predicted transposase/invertase (TIGR01784 family)